jgi:hypothetical protein
MNTKELYDLNYQLVEVINNLNNDTKTIVLKTPTLLTEE